VVTRPEDSLAHLQPESRTTALLPEAARLRLLRTERWWIANGQAQAALARLDILLHDGPGQIRPPNLLLAGPTNNGKSWIVERFRRTHAGAPREDAENLPIVVMQMPTEPTVSRFYSTLLANLGAPVPTGGSAARKQAMEQLAVRVLRGVGARVLVIDELHNMLAGTRTNRGEFLNLLRWIGNELRLPIVGVGTRDAWLAIRTDPQLENRFEPFVLPPWRPGPEAARLLQGFATLLPLRCASDLRGAETVRSVIARTGGTIGEIAALLRSAAETAILGGEESITPGVLDRAAYLGPGERRQAIERELA
jgi:hypothetical protein